MSGLILVVDDHHAVRLTVQQILESGGFKVMIAANGRDGVELLRSYKPDIIITDIFMPEQDGIELIIQARRERPDTKIIAMSGRGRVGNTSFLDIADYLGADATIAKPFDAELLLRSVRSVLGNKQCSV